MGYGSMVVLSDHPPSDHNHHPSSQQPSSHEPPGHEASTHQPSSHEPLENGPQPSAVSHRVVAILEVLICSDFLTQLAVSGTFVAFGVAPFAAHGTLSVNYVAG